ncbi:MAG: universal stress protein [Pseudomonadales bacterium]|nr:universal stress protein [Pseudomonadales bacterium]
MTRILAVIDPRDTVHHALDRCKEQPPEADLDIMAAVFVEHDTAENFAKNYAAQSEWLREQVTPYIAEGYKITTEVVPFEKLYEAVIETAAKHQADFVVKPMRQHSLFETVVRTTTDWNLIRHCPYPLLLVSDQDSIRNKPVLAAIDVCSGDENHEALNTVVLESARRLSSVLDSPTHTVNSWRTPTQMMAVGSIDTTPYPSPENLRKEHEEALHKVTKELTIAKNHLGEGSPTYAINQVAKEIAAGVIVLGTVARKGISGALIGNTAEGVLESANCDVMVCKQP